MVFDAEMTYTLEEHMAPDLDTMIADYNKNAKVFTITRLVFTVTRLVFTVTRMHD